MSMLEKREDVRGRALLVGLCCDSAAGFDNSDEDTMAELQELLELQLQVRSAVQVQV